MQINLDNHNRFRLNKGLLGLFNWYASASELSLFIFTTALPGANSPAVKNVEPKVEPLLTPSTAVIINIKNNQLSILFLTCNFIKILEWDPAAWRFTGRFTHALTRKRTGPEMRQINKEKVYNFGERVNVWMMLNFLLENTPSSALHKLCI